MMTMTHHLQALGVIWFLLAAVNVLVIPRWFDWKHELAQLSLLTRQVFEVHSLFIVFILVMMGALSFLYPHTLLQPSPLARLLLFGLFAFWAVRFLAQWLWYDRRLWRGNRFRTFVHFAFSLLWLYASGVYACAWWMQRTL